MTPRHEEQYRAFQEAIKESPHDEATHRIFADWLEERGFDDEARFHREEWTLDKQVAAETYMAWIVELLADQRWHAGIAVTVEQVLLAAHRYLDEGKCCWLPMNNEANGIEEADFWGHFHILTGRTIPANVLKRAQDIWNENTFFVCSCTSDSSFDKDGNLLEDLPDEWA